MGKIRHGGFDDDTSTNGIHNLKLQVSGKCTKFSCINRDKKCNACIHFSEYEEKKE